DTGPDPDLLSTCLRSLGIEHIDLLVLTHFDLDHVGGTAAVQALVSTVLHGPMADPPDRRLIDDLADEGAEVEQASAGRRGM
ncbi:MBL fold metallo-hydrolase, partial [Streptococcus pneumoniae]|nr:MBL fold metallo-hydrolase [Streptococcus pneumoniae]